MSDYSYWLLFLSAVLALNLAPGPDLIYVLSRTIVGGRRIGLASSLGVCTGAMVHVVASGLGLSVILATSALAFSLVKYVGAAYLLYLGIQALRHAGSSFDARLADGPPVSAWVAYRQGVLIDVLNPKVAIFFMAFLPQFVRPEHGAVPLQLLGLGALVIVVAILVEVVLVMLAARATQLIRSKRAFSLWLDRTLGSVLLVLGLRLALAERS